MKKSLLLLCAAVAGLSTAAYAEVYHVNSNSDFSTVFAKIGVTDDARDTVYIHAVDGGIAPGSINASGGGGNAHLHYGVTTLNGDSVRYYNWTADPNPNAAPHRGKIWYIGVDDENGNKAVFKPRVYYQNYDSVYHSSWIFENLNLQDYAPNDSKSYMFRFDRNSSDFDTICFRNCELSNLGQYVLWFAPLNLKRYYYDYKDTKAYDPFNFTEMPTSTSNANYYPISGVIDYFGIENCTVHGRPNTKASPFYYGSHIFLEVNISNNTFYDMPYLSGLIDINNLNLEEFEENAQTSDIRFVNNCWYVANNGSKALFNFGRKLGQMSNVEFRNNIFMYPDWTDDLNVAGTNQYGLVDAYEINVVAHNNVFDGYVAPFAKYNRPFDAVEDANAGLWYEADTTGNYSPADVSLSWNDMLDASGKLFQLTNSHKAYTAGKDGAPLGDTRWYVSTMPSKCVVKLDIQGSNTADVTMTPQKDLYLSGDVIRLTVDTHGLSDFIGWEDGSTDLVREVTVGDKDLTLVAKFKEHDYLAIFNFQERGADKHDAPYYSEVYKTTLPLEINYRTWNAATTAYVDTVANAVYSRGNKFSRPCIVVRTQKLYGNEHPDYLYITLPALDAGAKISTAIGTDNFIYSRTNIDVREVGTDTWTNIGSVTLNPDSVKYEVTTFHVNNPTIFADAEGNPYEATHYFLSNTWHPVSADIPASFAGKALEVRIMGDATSKPFLAADQYGNMKVQYANGVYDSEDPYTTKKVADGTAYFSGTEYLYLSEIEIDGSLYGTSAISQVVANEQTAGRMYDLLGRPVSGKAPAGIFVRNGRLFISK